jgi:hypothetical protein
LGCTAPHNRDLSPDQAGDALEAVCDAIFSGFRADFRYYVAKASDIRVECLVEAFDAWNTIKISIFNFQKISSLPPILFATGDQLSKLLRSRLTQTYDPTIDCKLITNAANVMKTDPYHDPRLVELLVDVASNLFYLREVGLPMPDVSDLLSKI